MTTATFTRLAEKKSDKFGLIELLENTAGLEAAGSGVRQAVSGFKVRTYQFGAVQTRQFATESEAWICFNSIH